MILTTTYNSPLAAPSSEDVAALLVSYKAYAGNDLLTLNDLYALMTTPGGERDSFLNSLTPAVTLNRSKYYTQSY